MCKIHDIGVGSQVSSIANHHEHVSSTKVKPSAPGKRACAKAPTPYLNDLKASLKSFHYPSWHSANLMSSQSYVVHR